MPRPRSQFPVVRLHKHSGQAYIHSGGKRHYLGPFGSAAARQKYAEFLARLASGEDVRQSASDRATVPDDPRITISELCLQFLLDAQERYRDPRTGKPNAELDCYRTAIKPLRQLFGGTPAAEFGPVKLRAVRDAFIKLGWARGHCNKQACRVRAIFRWAVSRELVPVTTLHALATLEPLRAGKSAARETPKRLAVPKEHLEAARRHLSDQARDLFDLMLLTGARSGELVGLNVDDIDRSGAVWSAVIRDHKNAWRGMDRKLFFGPQAQVVLQRRLDVLAARGRKRKADSRLFPFRRDSFSKAVSEACLAAGIPKFVPHQLRHTRATAVRDALGIESAQATLGHAQPSMTAHYSARLDTLAEAAALKLG